MLFVHFYKETRAVLKGHSEDSLSPSNRPPVTRVLHHTRQKSAELLACPGVAGVLESLSSVFSLVRGHARHIIVSLDPAPTLFKQRGYGADPGGAGLLDVAPLSPPPAEGPVFNQDPGFSSQQASAPLTHPTPTICGGFTSHFIKSYLSSCP